MLHASQDKVRAPEKGGTLKLLQGTDIVLHYREFTYASPSL